MKINWNTIKYDFIAFYRVNEFEIYHFDLLIKRMIVKKCIIRFDSIEKSERDGSTESF
jgi:hypothetical protein